MNGFFRLTQYADPRFSKRVRNLSYLLACLAVFTAVCPVSSATPEDESLVRRIDEAVFDREAHLERYSDIEHYTLRNSRLKKVSEMIVRVIYQKNAGKSFDVISEAGPSIVLGRVFKKLLADEQLRSRRGKNKSLVVSENYKMRLVGEAVIKKQPCYVLELPPKRKTKYLLVGRAWVLKKDCSLVRIEGKTAASLSFWTGRPFILREYENVQGFWLAKQTRATSSNWLIGRSELTIDHDDYNIVRDPTSNAISH